MSKLKDWLGTNAFLGRGWSFPLELTEEGVRMSSYEQDIKESLRILFSTSPGERVNPLRLRLPPAPLRFRTAHRSDIGADAERHHPCGDTLRTTHHAGGRVVRGTTAGRTVADTPHLHRGAYQQPQQHGLSVLFE